MIKKLYNYAVFQFGRYVYSRKIVIEAEKQVDENINTAEPRIPITVEKFSEKHITMLQDKVSERKAKIFKSRMNEDFYGFALLTLEKDIAAFGWITFADDIDPNTGVVLKTGIKGAILIDDYTFPEYRGNRLQTYIYNLKLQKLKELKFDVCRVAYLSDNVYSQRSILNNGFTETYRWTINKIFGVNFTKRNRI